MYHFSQVVTLVYSKESTMCQSYNPLCWVKRPLERGEGLNNYWNLSRTYITEHHISVNGESSEVQNCLCREMLTAAWCVRHWWKSLNRTGNATKLCEGAALCFVQEVQVESGKAVPFAQVGFSQHEAEPGLNTAFGVNIPSSGTGAFCSCCLAFGQENAWGGQRQHNLSDLAMFVPASLWPSSSAELFV